MAPIHHILTVYPATAALYRCELRMMPIGSGALAVPVRDTVEFFYRRSPDAASCKSNPLRWDVVHLYVQESPPGTFTASPRRSPKASVHLPSIAPDPPRCHPDVTITS